MGGAGDFRRRLHAYAARKAREDHDAFAAARGPQLNHTLSDVHLCDASAVDFNIELRTADRNHGAGSADLNRGRSAEMLLYAGVDPADQELQVAPSAGLGFFQNQPGARPYNNVTSVHEPQQETAVLRIDLGFRRKNIAPRWRLQCLARKLNTNTSLEVGNGCARKRRFHHSGCGFLGRYKRAVQKETKDLES
jgi:hypothetical protein